MSISYNFGNEVSILINLIKSQFEARTIINGRKTGQDFKEANLDCKIKENILYLTISTNEELHTITVPIPYIENGIILLRSNEVKRAVCNYFEVVINKEISYLEVIQKIFISDFTGYVESIKSAKTIFVQKLAYGIINNNLSVIVYNLQKAINEIVSNMPLHETTMNSWIMNSRLIIIDPNFDGITSPTEQLDYQVNKNRVYFDRGWTSIGLSDGSLAGKNYILKNDIRFYTPFGIRHHNPQRNLYSTLGMRGDELPNVRSSSAQKLIHKGITRKGWNLFTAFVDIPDTFEDQILIDKRHKNKYITSTKRFQLFGTLLVKKGDILKTGSPLVKCPDDGIEYYKIKADTSWVSKISKTIITVGGKKKHAYNIIVSFKRKLKDGTKFTNTHGNKGIIRIKSLGNAIDPLTKKERPIDIIVSAKSIKKRKNYGQLLEALINELNERQKQKKIPKLISNSRKVGRGIAVNSNIISVPTKPKPVIIPDDLEITEHGLNNIKTQFKTYGFSEDLTWECNTYIGKVKAICGTVFWGVSKNVEDQLWDKTDTIRRNNKDVRTAGLKFSTVEFKALETRFGVDNAIMDEILTYTQGTENIEEELKILRSKMGIFPSGLKTKTIGEVKFVDQSNGTMFNKEALIGTISDEHIFPEGFLLKLPLTYQTTLGFIKDFNQEGPAILIEGQYDKSKYKAVYNTNTIYVPCGELRRSWRHSTGMRGMSELTVLINNILLQSNKYLESPEDGIIIRMLYQSIATYFMRVSKMLGTKSGDINNHAMSVRYPYSAKAVAALSNSLKPNTIQIHKDMANTLNVRTGDIVIAERFPCLGFMGIRPQKVDVTNDPMCKYTIRVSGNSLVSTNLDFDGDVVYLASFHTKEAKKLLKKEWETPNEACWKHIDWLNNRKGSPTINCLNINNYDIGSFPIMTNEKQQEIVNKLTGVKAQTGPVIALAYNLMRIIENSGIDVTNEQKANVEMFIEKTGQSVFEQKHGGESLHSIVMKAICTADNSTLIAENFDKDTSEFICNIIKTKAANIGIHDLITHYNKVIERGGSNIINIIVRKENKIYFASRSFLDCCDLLEFLNAKVVDLPSKIFKLTTSGKYNSKRTILDEQLDAKLLNRIKDTTIKAACSKLISFLDIKFGVIKEKSQKFPKMAKTFKF